MGPMPFVSVCVSVADGLELPTVSKCTEKSELRKNKGEKKKKKPQLKQ